MIPHTIVVLMMEVSTLEHLVLVTKGMETPETASTITTKTDRES